MSTEGVGQPRRFAALATTAPAEVQVLHGPRPNQKFEPLPTPTGRPPYRVELADVLGAAEVDAIRAAGQLTFHVAGDTGGTADRAAAQHIVADHMVQDLARDGHTRPRFFYHLGDVVYYHGQTIEYQPQFYEPYHAYDAPILPIPGNHDGSIGDPSVPSLTGFVRNFCAPRPHVTPEAGDINRDAMTLPNVYWTLRAPFATIVGTYTNVPEGGHIAPDQAAWLAEELRAAPPHTALIVALHHPIYSGSQEHIGSIHLREVLDAAAEKAGRLPDIVLTGHVHNYQRFTRRYQQREIPYLVAGAGGHSPLNKIPSYNDQKVPQPFVIPSDPDVTLERYAEERHGYLRLTATATALHGEYVTVPRPHEHDTHVRDAFTVDLEKHRVSDVKPGP
jgi:3',5'-cyclic AMP phosphodiesterase CpdA